MVTTARMKTFLVTCIILVFLSANLLRSVMWEEKIPEEEILRKMLVESSSRRNDAPISNGNNSPPPPPPTAVLHFGPRKTGTTTMQDGLDSLARRHGLTSQDRINYVGRASKLYMDGARLYLKSDEERRQDIVNGDHYTSKGYKKWTRKIRQGAINKYHVIISEEDIGRMHLYHKRLQLHEGRRENSSTDATIQQKVEDIRVGTDTLAILRDDLFSAYAGNYRVTATYRRYFEWLPSDHQQQFFGISMFDRSAKLCGFVTWYRKYVTALKENDLATLFVPPFRTIAPLRREEVEEWGAFFDTKVHIYNMYEAKKSSLPMAVHWLCEVVPDIAQHTCQEAAQSNSTTYDDIAKELNTWHDHIQAKEISIEALEQGILNRRKVLDTLDDAYDVQESVLERVQAKIDEDNITLPTACLSDDEIQEIWETSQQMQRDLMPDDADGIQEAWKQFKREKFCQVNATKLLMREDWIDFFRGLPDQITE